ncbi:MAG: HD domain-containing protein [candidate division Zixibacteria bacterium]|nr:HD domain-containing protein [candidate division Zixibacteria bacterium]MDH3936250.1 HD domain-containing protein [candidate division Zixibacteria bacterium]MDH4034875.1 HD domain-containing protein [candidate division Zixibacteria bacterium]
MDFNAKTICDSVHGSIGISELEQRIINTRTFQRLKKIKQLGLASLVFPGAEHSRFAHSIGAMHIMSRMVDGLRAAKCPHVSGENGDEIKQKLRLAALLHDIGHYPLAHLGEQAFQWVDYIKRVEGVTEGEELEDRRSLLQRAAESPKSQAAKHERLGEKILTHSESELRRLIAEAGFEPAEIARIINAEDKDNPFHIQLMSSTLDCDRVDFLLRDSLASGTSFGQVDINYIIANIYWDSESQRVCFKSKAKNAIEHFIMSRYFSYNLTYHKTVMGFELMAKTLFFMMMSDDSFPKDSYGGIATSLAEVDDRIGSDPEFLANFTDEYFWYYLEKSGELGFGDDLFKRLRRHLLHREPLRPLWEERLVADLSNDEISSPFKYVSEKLLDDLRSRQDCQDSLDKAGLNVDDVVVLSKQIDFEGVTYSRPYYKKPPNAEDLYKLVKIHSSEKTGDLIQDPGSIIRVLSNYQQRIARVYALVPKDSKEERALRDIIRDRVEDN